METLDALAQTFDHAAAVIGGVRPEQMTAPTPCTEWDVRALLTHTIGVVTNVGCGVRGDALLPDVNAIALDADFARQFRIAADGTLAAWRSSGFDGEVNIGAGPMPASLGAQINLVDTASHAWDIARATGQAEDLPAELAAAVLSSAQGFVSDDIRNFAGIASAIEVGAAATPTEAFVAFMGRRPESKIRLVGRGLALASAPMRRSIDDALDDHPADEEFPAISWMVGLTDDPGASEDGEPRVSLTLEERGGAGYGLVAHLAPATARRLRGAIAAALREVGEDPGS